MFLDNGSRRWYAIMSNEFRWYHSISILGFITKQNTTLGEHQAVFVECHANIIIHECSFLWNQQLLFIELVISTSVAPPSTGSCRIIRLLEIDKDD